MMLLLQPVASAVVHLGSKFWSVPTGAEVVALTSVELTPATAGAADASPDPAPSVAPMRFVGVAESLQPSGMLLRVDAEVDALALREVLAALETR